MSYRIIFDKRVFEVDFKDINKDIQERIMTAIKNRLLQAPEQYGELLHKTLKKYWKLRIGDYRIVFNIVKNEINIFAIMHRKKIYSAIFKRI